MGITPAILTLLARECRSRGLRGAVLTLGNQDVWLGHQQVRERLEAEGITPVDVPVKTTTSVFLAELSSQSNLDYRNFIHAETLFRMLGFDSYADLDKFDRDGAGVHHDLNQPLPEGYHGRFDLITDFGTTEHIFSVGRVLESVARGLRVGGCAIHVLPLPSVQWAQHGYYCFNPDLLIDFYRLNGFQNIECRVLYYPKPPFRQIDAGIYFRSARLFSYKAGMPLQYLVPKDSLPSFWLVAQKSESRERFVPPDQASVEGPGVSVTSTRRVRGLLKPLYFAAEPVFGSLLRKAYTSLLGVRVASIH